MTETNPTQRLVQVPRIASGDSANLDFLRSFAVLLVFCTHFYDIYTGRGTKWDVLWHIGQLGVLMFFVHTSLVLMWSLERSGLHGKSLYASFYVRRLFRLYPLSIVCVLIAYCFDARWSPVNLWPNLTLTQNLFFKHQPTFPPTFTPLWSLPLEVQMYVVLPALFVLLRNRSIKLLGGIWLVSVAIAMIQPDLGARFEFFKFAPCFLGGVIAWRAMRDGETARLPGWLWPLALAAVSVIWMTATEKYLPLSIAAFGVCLGVAIPFFKEVPWRMVRDASRIIARYSYGIYLTHFFIMVYVFGDPHNLDFKVIHQLPRIKHFARPIEFSLVIVFSVIAPVLLYHLIEKPGIRLGRKLAEWMTRPNSELDAAIPSGAVLPAGR